MAQSTVESSGERLASHRKSHGHGAFNEFLDGERFYSAFMMHAEI